MSVFFIDDRQVVRPKEVGSSDLIRGCREEVRCRYWLDHYDLDAQFRCAGLRRIHQLGRQHAGRPQDGQTFYGTWGRTPMIFQIVDSI